MDNLCAIRDIYRLIRDFEMKFQQKYHLCLNEGMLLCCLKETQRSSSEIADILRLTNSNASKVIKAVEKKGYVKRLLGQDDKRQMNFELTEMGLAKIGEIKCVKQEIDDILSTIVKGG